MSGDVALEPDISTWAAWTPDEVSELLAGVDAPWYVAGGWAIDLHLGEQRREHGDLEIAVPRSHFAELATALSEYELYAVQNGVATSVAEAPGTLDTTHQTWVRDTAADGWRLDIFREPSDEATWVFRRDPTIRLPYQRAVRRTATGIPYGTPEIILLFKAAAADEEKHADDFAAVLPFLESERRRWLAAALEETHPRHIWLDDLQGV